MTFLDELAKLAEGKTPEEAKNFGLIDKVVEKRV